MEQMHASVAQYSPYKPVQEFNCALQNDLNFSRIAHTEPSCQQQCQHHPNCHHNPSHHYRFCDRNSAQHWNREHSLCAQLLHQTLLKYLQKLSPRFDGSILRRNSSIWNPFESKKSIESNKKCLWKLLPVACPLSVPNMRLQHQHVEFRISAGISCAFCLTVLYNLFILILEKGGIYQCLTVQSISSEHSSCA